MKDTALNNKQLKALVRMPFLSEFPYSEISYSHQVMHSINSANEVVSEPFDVVTFSYDDDTIMPVNIMEKEVWHLHDICKNANDLSIISRAITSAIQSDDLQVKSTATRKTTEWFEKLKGKNFSIGAGTFSDILTTYAGKKNIELITQLSNIAHKLHKGRGIVCVSPKHKAILLKYYQFQLMYYKILIGIIIAAKISI